MTPETNRQMLIKLLEAGYDVYTSVTPSPCFMLHFQGEPALKCFPCQAWPTKTGIRGCLQRASDLWKLCDLIVFFDPASTSLWLVPVTSIPSGGTTSLGPSYDGFLLTKRASASPPINMSEILALADALSSKGAPKDASLEMRQMQDRTMEPQADNSANY